MTDIQTIPPVVRYEAPRETLPVVICQCSECDCQRRDKGLSYATSSLLVCMSCCLERHVRIKDKWCPTCDQRLPR